MKIMVQTSYFSFRELDSGDVVIHIKGYVLVLKHVRCSF